MELTSLNLCHQVCICLYCVCLCARSFSHIWLFATPWTAGLLCPWGFPSKNTRVGCHFLLQGIFLTKGSNLYLLCLLHWQADSLPLHHLGSKHYSSEGQLVSRQTTETSGPTCWKPRCSLFLCRFIGLLSCHYKQRPRKKQGTDPWNHSLVRAECPQQWEAGQKSKNFLSFAT